MSFSKIVGQERAVELLKADLKSRRAAESYIFAGPKGSGKRQAATELAKTMNCANPKSNEPCDACLSCKKIDRGVHPDFFILDFNSQVQLLNLDEEDSVKQKEFKIDAVRILIQRAYKTPAEGSVKVTVIDPAELLTEESANALLKVLEESPKHARWVLLTSNFDRVIPTIRSRCRKISFSFLETALINDENTLELKKFALALVKREVQDPFGMSLRVLEKGKKGNQRIETEKFLKIAAMELSSELKAAPTLGNARNLELILRSQEELRRNVSPQLILDNIFLAFS